MFGLGGRRKEAPVPPEVLKIAPLVFERMESAFGLAVAHVVKSAVSGDHDDKEMRKAVRNFVTALGSMMAAYHLVLHGYSEELEDRNRAHLDAIKDPLCAAVALRMFREARRL